MPSRSFRGRGDGFRGENFIRGVGVFRASSYPRGLGGQRGDYRGGNNRGGFDRHSQSSNIRASSTGFGSFNRGGFGNSGRGGFGAHSSGFGTYGGGESGAQNRGGFGTSGGFRGSRSGYGNYGRGAF